MSLSQKKSIRCQRLIANTIQRVYTPKVRVVNNNKIMCNHERVR